MDGRFRAAATALFVSLILGSGFCTDSRAQDSSPFILGVGFQTVVSTDDGLGFGFGGRASTPLSSTLSFAGDLGVFGFFLGGRESSSLAIMPQVSAIVTLPGETSARYIMAGLGLYLSSGGEDSGDHNGPTLHFGYGGARPLGDSTLFYEVNPGIVIKESTVGLVVPLRIGIIL